VHTKGDGGRVAGWKGAYLEEVTRTEHIAPFRWKPSLNQWHVY
jgi:hypothetical protein